MTNFNFRSLLAMPHCGKDIRKYIYVMGVSAVVILISTYLYEYYYLSNGQAAPKVTTAAVNQLQPTNVPGQFASPGMGLGMNVRQPSGPPIRANANIPGSHKRDGRAEMPCADCHQINGQGRWAQVAFMTPINQDPHRLNANNRELEAARNNRARNNQGMNNQGLNNQMLLAANDQIPFAQVVANLRNSIVNINSVQTTGVGKLANAELGGTRFADPLTGTSMESLGSGIIVSQNGHILTNYHVIKNATGIFVTVFTDVGQKRYSADVVKMDEKLDLAVVKIQPDEILIAAPLGDSDTIQVADSVIAIGSPFGLDQTVSRGIISGLRKSIVIDKITHAQLIQTDAAINTGNSGGALVSRDGAVIGINTAIYTPTGAFSGIGFAVPMNQAKLFMADIQNINNVNLTMQQGNGMGLNVAAVAAPPIRANDTPPGSHQDGRNQMACTTCHQVGGAGGNGQGNPVAFTNNFQAGVPMGVNVARGQGGPRILAGTQSPHRDGREKMDCNICHQVIQPNVQAQANAVGFMQPIQNGMNQFAPIPDLGMTVAGAGTVPASSFYFDGAILEPITPVIAQRINTQVDDGAFVSSVYPDTAASRAGLHAGDIIFKINGRWVLSPEDLLQRVSEYTVGDNLRLGVYTGGQRRNLYLILSGQVQSPQTNITNQLAPATTTAPTVKLPSEINWLGLEMKPITPEVTAKDQTLQGKTGTLIKDVDRNSSGELAGIQKGDVVRRLNGLPVNDINSLDRVVNGANIAQGILFLVDRNGRSIYLTIK